jgi:hypothetical protein
MEKRICSIDDCDGSVIGRGWCSKHYKRWQVHGDPLPRVRIPNKSKPCTVEGCERRRNSPNFCTMHDRRMRIYGEPEPRKATTAERFWSKVDKTGECWLWTGYIKPNGYASFAPKGSSRNPTKLYVHRYSYELAHGDIPADLEIDHTCSVRHCVNPDHLEAVTRAVNLERRNITNGWVPLAGRWPKPPKTHCKFGHPFDEANTYWWRGYRHCKTCRKQRQTS